MDEPHSKVSPQYVFSNIIHGDREYLTSSRRKNKTKQPKKTQNNSLRLYTYISISTRNVPDVFVLHLCYFQPPHRRYRIPHISARSFRRCARRRRDPPLPAPERVRWARRCRRARAAGTVRPQHPARPQSSPTRPRPSREARPAAPSTVLCTPLPPRASPPGPGAPLRSWPSRCRSARPVRAAQAPAPTPPSRLRPAPPLVAAEAAFPRERPPRPPSPPGRAAAPGRALRPQPPPEAPRGSCPALGPSAARRRPSVHCAIDPAPQGPARDGRDPGGPRGRREGRSAGVGPA